MKSRIYSWLGNTHPDLQVTARPMWFLSIATASSFPARHRGDLTQCKMPGIAGRGLITVSWCPITGLLTDLWRRETAPLPGLSWYVGAAEPGQSPPSLAIRSQGSRVGSMDALGVGTACDMFWRGRVKALCTLIFFAHLFRDPVIKLQISVSVNTSGEKKKIH